MTLLKLTKIPQLNSIVIKQEGGHFFIATPNSFIIDKEGMYILISELVDRGFLDFTRLMEYLLKDKGVEIKHENEENSSNID